MEKEDKRVVKNEQEKTEHHISVMKPVTEGAYGGGLYGSEEGMPDKPSKPPASETQSADGKTDAAAATEPKHKPPSSTGDRDLDITGQSYIQ
ncbi:hypothetical protein QJS04_geneDACA009730 [Acorus gramineus]|uniref:Uncharacterized protein n=1 Tax=Acorus gramineus TaxID=55184 RepID=A0AAV9BBT5_ACOGR|nr:hypothetical protein QJS04_geneDACA009730 [Acorus gramineus]